jgi:hypothetical protein
VTLVNDRSETYTRNRIVDFDRKWMAFIRFFLGSKYYNELFGKNEQEQKTSIGIELADDIGLVNMKNMENALKERLKELSEFVEQKQEGPFIRLIYETAVLDLAIDDNRNTFAVLGRLFYYNLIQKFHKFLKDIKK